MFDYNNEDLDLHSEGFRDALSLAPQNELNLLLPAVYVEPSPPAGDYINSDFMQPSTPSRKAAFNAPTPDKNLAMVRRVAMWEAWQDSAWINDMSMLHGLSDPTSPIMMSLEAGRQRGHQDIILAALNGPGYQYNVDKSGELINRVPVEKAFPSGQVIAVDFAGHHEDETIAGSGNQNYTYGKVNRARTMLNKAKIVGGKKFLICDQDGAEVMLNKKIMTNRDYQQAEKIKEDGIGYMLGFNWIILPDELPEVASGVRGYFALNSNAIKFARRDITAARIKPRADRSDALQAYYSEEVTAGRMIDEGVVQINVDLNA